MTKEALKKSTPKDEFICLTCPLSDCVPNSHRCPINAKQGQVDDNAYNLIVYAFTERDRLKKLRDDLTREIARVRSMRTRTKSRVNKHLANIEIDRLKELLKNATLHQRSLKAKCLAEKFEVPLHVVTNIAKKRFL